MNNTQDLAKFGFHKIAIAGKLLSKYAENDLEGFSHDEVRLEFDPNSGDVFLVNADYRIAMLNDKDELRLWLICRDCGTEGFEDDIDYVFDMNICKECFDGEEDS